MGGGGSQTTTQRSDPWSGQQPYLTDIFRQAQSLYNQGPQQFYPGQTVAPFSPQSQMGMDMMTQLALGGNPVTDAFGSYLQNQLGQQNIDPNAIFDPAQQAAGGLGAGQQLMGDAAGAAMGMGDPNAMVGGAADALGGMTGFGGLGEASQFAGMPGLGSLPAANDYVQQTLAQSPQFSQFADQIGGRLGGGAGSQLQQTAAGDYLGSNPYLDQLFDTASSRAGEAFNEQTMPAIAAQFGSAGRTGSGLHQEMGENAMRQFGRDLQGMAADIYSPAYESERNRMVQAAGAGGQLDLGGLGLAGDLYGGEQQRRLGAAGLGGNLYSAQNAAELGRLGLGSDLYLGERGLAQQGASQLGQLGLGQGQLGLGGLNAAIGAGGQLGQLGLGGIGAMGDLYGDIAQNQFRAGTLAPSFDALRYGGADRLMGVGGRIEDQSQRLMDANMQRYMFGQQAPWQNLNNYMSAIYGLPGGYGTQTSTQPTGSRLGGAIGGAMAGSSLGPWGMAGGALMGLLG